MKNEISISFSDFEAALQGDIKSTARVIMMARFLCSIVEDLRQSQPGVARQIARKLPDWPALVARHKAARERVTPTLKELQLAEDYPARAIFARDGKGPDLGRELNAVALDIWEWMGRYRRPTFGDAPGSAQFRALPEFTTDRFSEWWNMGWTYYVKSVGGNPFNDPRLKRERRRIERVANKEGITAEARVRLEVMKAAKKLWPLMSHNSDRIGT